VDYFALLPISRGRLRTQAGLKYDANNDAWVRENGRTTTTCDGCLPLFEGLANGHYNSVRQITYINSGWFSCGHALASLLLGRDTSRITSLGA
jgi:hypothetical protein